MGISGVGMTHREGLELVGRRDPFEPREPFGPLDRREPFEPLLPREERRKPLELLEPLELRDGTSIM